MPYRSRGPITQGLAGCGGHLSEILYPCLSLYSLNDKGVFNGPFSLTVRARASRLFALEQRSSSWAETGIDKLSQPHDRHRSPLFEFIGR